LEEDIAKLSRREDRRMHRLKIARCQKCHGKVDLRSLHRAAEGDERFVRSFTFSCVSYLLLPL
jgi:myosin protein heavy chain